MPLHPSRRSWEISREHVEVIKVIGKGAFSDVAKATLRNMRDNQEIIIVAAKMLKGEAVVLDLFIGFGKFKPKQWITNPLTGSFV